MCKDFAHGELLKGKKKKEHQGKKTYSNRAIGCVFKVKIT
jgi:hypothetical protein